MTDLIIWGASGHAMVVADAAQLTGRYRVVGFIDDATKPSPLAGVPFLGGREHLAKQRERGVRHLIVAIGDWTIRLRLAEVAKSAGFELATVIHPHATIARDVNIGEGSVVMAGAVVNPGSQLGTNVIINTCASVDHQCVLHDGVQVAPGARLAGNVTVERGAFIGLGACVKEKLRIGAGAIVGAGAVVLRDVPAQTVVYGVPAKIARKVE